MLVDGYQSRHLFNAEPFPLLQLDRNVVVEIYKHLDLESRVNLAMTCKQMYQQFGHGARFKRLPDHRQTVRKINELRENRNLLQRLRDQMENDNFTKVAVYTGNSSCLCCAGGTVALVCTVVMPACGPITYIVQEVISLMVYSSCGTAVGGYTAAGARQCYLTGCNKNLWSETHRLEQEINENISLLPRGPVVMRE